MWKRENARSRCRRTEKERAKFFWFLCAIHFMMCMWMWSRRSEKDERIAKKSWKLHVENFPMCAGACTCASCWLSLSTQIIYKHGNKYTLKIHFFRSTYSHSIFVCLCSIRLPFFFSSGYLEKSGCWDKHTHIVLVSLTKWDVHSIFLFQFNWQLKAATKYINSFQVTKDFRPF